MNNLLEQFTNMIKIRKLSISAMNLIRINLWQSLPHSTSLYDVLCEFIPFKCHLFSCRQKYQGRY